MILPLSITVAITCNFLGFISILLDLLQQGAGQTTSRRRESDGRCDGTVWESDGDDDGVDIRCQT